LITEDRHIRGGRLSFLNSWGEGRKSLRFLNPSMRRGQACDVLTGQELQIKKKTALVFAGAEKKEGGGRYRSQEKERERALGDRGESKRKKKKGNITSQPQARKKKEEKIISSSGGKGGQARAGLGADLRER